MTVNTVTQHFLTGTKPEDELTAGQLSSFASTSDLSLDGVTSHSTSTCSSKSTKNVIKCSAVSSLERAMPTFDYSHLVRELRDKVLEEFKTNPHYYTPADIEKFRQDTWSIERFLLRQKLDVELAFEMLKKALRFNREGMINSCQTCEFPFEFYRMAGVFGYEPDRKGNLMLYMRCKMHKRIPEIISIFESFIFHQIKKLDEEANGRGISIVIDLTDAGVANADLEVVTFLLTSLNNYFPKGLSYFLIHNLPWILKPFWYIVRAWLSDEQKDLIKFSDSKTIYEYVDKENLPDFMGGTCQRDYRVAPANCASVYEVMKLFDLDSSTVKKIRDKFVEYLPQDALDSIESCLTTYETTLSDENEKRIIDKYFGPI